MHPRGCVLRGIVTTLKTAVIIMTVCNCHWDKNRTTVLDELVMILGLRNACVHSPIDIDILWYIYIYVQSTTCVHCRPVQRLSWPQLQRSVCHDVNLMALILQFGTKSKGVARFGGMVTCIWTTTKVGDTGLQWWPTLPFSHLTPVAFRKWFSPLSFDYTRLWLACH